MNKLLAILKNPSNKIYQAGAILAFFSLVSRLAGLLRDRVLASEFGASSTLDVYYSAFKIPDFIFNLIVLGAVSAAFIPVFMAEFNREERGGWQLAQNFLNFLLAVIVGLTILGIIFARPLVRLVSPGFDDYNFELTVIATQIMFLSPILFTISTVLGSILQSFKKFLAYSVAPVFYNLGIIIGAIYFVPFFKGHNLPEIEGLALGVVFGALLHLIVQLPGAYRLGFRFGPSLDWKNLALRKVFRLMIPRTIALAGNSINAVITNSIISFLPVGSIAIFNLGYNLHFVPVAIVGISMGTALFPTITEHAIAGQIGELKRKTKDALIKTGLASFAISIIFAILARPIVKLLLGVGNFNSANIDLTARVLVVFMIGVAANSLVQILVRVFYALQDTKTPTLISLISICLGIALSLLFVFYFKLGVMGAALGFSLSTNLNFMLLLVALWIKTRSI